MAIFAKPENALKRAEELINVGQNLEALQLLHDFITSKRNRGWQKSNEKVMFKHIELCVDLRKGRYAKDALIQYRSQCQQVNVNSLEEVIKHFMHLSTQKAEKASTEAQALQEALDVEDLEADNRPEDLMLSYVSGEKGKDRSDRELVTPWFKLLWETYRTVLDVLRNNSKLEALYAMAARRAFQFCKQYKRTTEFRRLCEIIRNHLAILYKYRDQRDRPDLSAPESLQLYLDTRFEQLKVASELQLWQEAFRSVEDIHGLMCMVKKTPKPSVMVIYYAKLTEIFWISSSHLYHAYAWFKLFMLQKSVNKNLSQKDLQLMASSVVLAALAVAPYDRSHIASHMGLENQKEWNWRIANLIGFNVDPKPENREVLSRSSLLSELASKCVINCATQEVRDLYLLEHEFLPLNLVEKIQPLLSKISKVGGKLASASSVPEVQLSRYVPALEKLVTLRLLQQVSQVYQTMKIKSLSHMIPFFDFFTVEKIAVDAVKHNFIAMKVDHMKNVVMFGNLGLESYGLREHLTIFAESLNKARALIYPLAKESSKLGEVLPGLGVIVEKEHKRLLARKSILQKRKEEQDYQLLEMEQEELSERLKLEKIAGEAEQKRLAAEYEQRKSQRNREVREEREHEEARALYEEHIKNKGGKNPILEGEKLTKEMVMEMAHSKKLRERQEMDTKLQKQAKRMDYLERAKREAASPLIEAAFQRRSVEEKALHELQQQQEIELSRQSHDWDLSEKNRLARMLNIKTIFEVRVRNRRREEFDQQRAEREAQINQIIQARKKEREANRKKLLYVTSEEERLQRLHEEEEAREHAESERRRKEAAERKEKLDKIAEKQRQREHELEEKERLRREALLGRSSDGTYRSSDSLAGSRPEVGASSSTAAAPSSGKYVPKFRLAGTEATAPTPSDSASTAAAPSSGNYVPKFRRAGIEVSAPAPPDSDWSGIGSGRQAPSDSDKWSSSGARQPPSDTVRWGSGSTRPDDGNLPSDMWRGGGSKSTRSSSRPRGR